MKIKRKVEMNLPQLIEYAWENNVKGKFFPIDQNEESGIYFATNNDFMMKNADFIRYDNTFTVEVEEEITEDTEFKRLVYIDDDDDTVAFSNFTIRELKDNGVKEFHAYIDGEFKLVWRNGKLEGLDGR